MDGMEWFDEFRTTQTLGDAVSVLVCMDVIESLEGWFGMLEMLACVI